MMALGEKDPERGPAYAEDTPPRLARASVVVDDFADLLPVLLAWRTHFGPDVVAYAMPTLADELGQPTGGWEQRWHEEGPMYRLSTLRGGYVQVTDYSEAVPAGRPLDDSEVGHGHVAGEIDQ